MKKRMIRMLLGFCMLGITLSGCTSGAGNTSNSGNGANAGNAANAGAEAGAAEQDTAAAFKIGMRFPVTLDTMQQQTMHNVQEAVETAGGSLIIENTALTPEGNIQAYERLIAAGADGLVVIPAADSVLPRIKAMCEEAQIPWSIYYRSILDEDIKAEIEASPYYLGNTYEDEYLAGYNLTAKMGSAGCKNIVLFSTALGDTTGEQREAGMYQACEEYGIEVINEFRAVEQASDAAQSMESVLNTHPEVDGIFISAGTLTPGILPALTNLLNEYGRNDVKITIIDFPQGLEDAFDAGYMLAACGGHNITDPIFAVSMVLNELKGTRLSETPVSVRINQMILESKEDVQNYFKYCESGISTYTPDELKAMMFKFEDAELTLETFLAAAGDYTLQTVMERHEALIE